jgi:hypothetical protein
MIPYARFSYIHPPRPETAIAPNALAGRAAQGFYTQVKKNGTRNLVFVAPPGETMDGQSTLVAGRQIQTWNRHNGRHKTWKESPEALELLASHALGWSVFDTELINARTKDIKDKIYVFDVLVYAGQRLVGTTCAQRWELLTEIFADHPPIGETDSHFILNDYVWLAKVHKTDIPEVYKWAVASPENEGLVLKDPNGVLTLSNSPVNNTSWQAKCRRPEASNASF